MNTCPYCKARINPLRWIFRGDSYRCGRCGRLSKLPWKQQLVLGGVNLLVLLLMLSTQWQMWQRLVLYMLVSFAAHAVVMHIFMRFEPVENAASNDVV